MNLHISLLLLAAAVTGAVWAAVLIDGYSKSAAENAGAGMPLLAFECSVYAALLLVVVQEGTTTRYHEAGFLAGVISHSTSQLAVRGLSGLIYISCFASIISALRRDRQTATPKQSTMWLPYIGAWGLSAVLGRFPGVSSTALLAVCTVIPMALLPAVPPRAICRIGFRAVRVVVGVSLLLGVTAAQRVWAPANAWPGGWHLDVPRLQGILPQPNALGWIAAVGIVLELRGPARRFRYASLAAAAVTLALSGSRSPAIALVIAVLVVKPHGGGRFELGALARRAGVILAAAIMVSQMLGSGERLSTANGRTRTWEQASEVFVSSPLLGSGPGAYAQARGDEAAVPYAHNQLLHTAAELGVVGLMTVFYHLSRVYRTGRSAPNRPLASALTVMWYVMLLPENLLRFTGVAFTLQLIAFGVALHLALAVDASREMEVDGTGGPNKNRTQLSGRPVVWSGLSEKV